MTDYVIEKIKMENTNSGLLSFAKVRLFNNTKKKPFYVNSYNLTRDQIIASIRTGKVFSTFYIPDKSNRKPKVVDKVFLVKNDESIEYLTIDKNENPKYDNVGNVPLIKDQQYKWGRYEMCNYL